MGYRFPELRFCGGSPANWKAKKVATDNYPAFIQGLLRKEMIHLLRPAPLSAVKRKNASNNNQLSDSEHDSDMVLIDDFSPSSRGKRQVQKLKTPASARHITAKRARRTHAMPSVATITQDPLADVFTTTSSPPTAEGQVANTTFTTDDRDGNLFGGNLRQTTVPLSVPDLLAMTLLTPILHTVTQDSSIDSSAPYVTASNHGATTSTVAPTENTSANTHDGATTSTVALTENASANTVLPLNRASPAGPESGANAPVEPATYNTVSSVVETSNASITTTGYSNKGHAAAEQSTTTTVMTPNPGVSVEQASGAITMASNPGVPSTCASSTEARDGGNSAKDTGHPLWPLRTVTARNICGARWKEQNCDATKEAFDTYWKMLSKQDKKIYTTEAKSMVCIVIKAARL
ncbi:hypothetical protein HETIRDRAFT_330713 [Heterobasidion irregulare TC 32-1]|uniref:Uncharacterized protein n=1 Tax=Heterobasidion irregulare (strain TC 32-1) TaxID=747525 RepID=W4JNH2_HETIT|nr:uncharacterized protein HETIRDRAFT_330713 [Heterobasidion irregulare TC 32-1]ETW75107.1 hypothetical protein HETIRDRAFT_330713 [Heterobasidion irregulare TC 32-1]